MPLRIYNVLTRQKEAFVPLTEGKVNIYVRGKVIAELPVVTASDVAATDNMWEKAWDSTLIMMFGG